VGCEAEVIYEEISFVLNHGLNWSGAGRFVHTTTGNDNDSPGNDRSIANPVEEEERGQKKSLQDTGLN
jgi:hypothetical protein